MTELGHGSNVSGLETTAIFDRAHDSFVIHTPSVTATKWWIGGAAQSATHTYEIKEKGKKREKMGLQYGKCVIVTILRNVLCYEYGIGIILDMIVAMVLHIGIGIGNGRCIGRCMSMSMTIGIGIGIGIEYGIGIGIGIDTCIGTCIGTWCWYWY